MKLILVTIAFLMTAQAQAAEVLKLTTQPIGHRPGGTQVVTVDEKGVVVVSRDGKQQAAITLHSSQVSMIYDLIEQAKSGKMADNSMGMRCRAMPHSTVQVTALDGSMLLSKAEVPCGDAEYNDSAVAGTLVQMMDNLLLSAE